MIIIELINKYNFADLFNDISKQQFLSCLNNKYNKYVCLSLLTATYHFESRCGQLIDSDTWFNLLSNWVSCVLAWSKLTATQMGTQRQPLKKGSLERSKDSVEIYELAVRRYHSRRLMVNWVAGRTGTIKKITPAVGCLALKQKCLLIC